MAFLKFIYFASTARKFVIVGNEVCHMMQKGLADEKCLGEVTAW